MLRLCRASVFFSGKKKTQIPFDFKLPRQDVFSTTFDPDKQSQVVKTKFKRRGIERFGLKKAEPVYQSEQDHQSQTQKIYQQEIKQKDEENFATHRFYKHELDRGEDLIDDIPIEPYYQYKREDLQKSLEQRQDQFKKILSIPKIIEDKKLRLQNLRTILRGFQDSKHRFQLEEFQKKLQQYPGSLKGRHPQEDPAAFKQYAMKIMPEWLRGQLQLQKQALDAQQQNRSLSQGQEDDDLAYDDEHISNLIGMDRKLVGPIDEQVTAELVSETVRNDLKDIKNIVPYSQIPYLPQINFEQFHSHFYKVRLWGTFRSFYELRILESKKKQLEEILTKMQEQYIEKNGNAYLQIPQASYSLYTYYKTLPKQVQENVAVRTVYLGLEYSQPDISYEEKEQTLNKAAAMSRPLDKFSTAAMNQLIEKKKFHLTPHLVDRIYNMHPQFTWDIHQFLQQVKQEKLRSMSTVKEKEESFPEPPQKQLDWESGMANLPVDFYDNDDGFWDQYIDEKLQKYQRVRPLSNRPKTHFIH